MKTIVALVTITVITLLAGCSNDIEALRSFDGTVEMVYRVTLEPDSVRVQMADSKREVRAKRTSPDFAKLANLHPGDSVLISENKTKIAEQFGNYFSGFSDLTQYLRFSLAEKGEWPH